MPYAIYMPCRRDGQGVEEEEKVDQGLKEGKKKPV
jgi:hypothetical protein